MSFEHTVVVRGRKQRPEKILELAARLAQPYEGTLITAEDAEDEEADDDPEDGSLEVCVAFPRGRGGTIEIWRLLKGYRLHIDSQRDGNRESWDDIGGLLNDLAAKLGTEVDDETALAMIEESDIEPETPPMSSIAIIMLEDREGTLLEEARVPVVSLQPYIAQGGALRECPLHPMLTEDGRYASRASRLVALLHDSDGAAMRRYRWTLDGYGRITGIDVDELWATARTS